jgi:hypothetical protein
MRGFTPMGSITEAVTPLILYSLAVAKGEIEDASCVAYAM